MALIFLGILVVIVVLLIGMYNSLVQLRVRCDNAWSDIDVQLKRRYDLIPNLVESVKGYATHERTAFENVTAARSAAMSAQGPAAKAQAEGQLAGALKTLFAVAEAYPDLKASTNFMQLQTELSDLENKIAASRRFLNNAVQEYNSSIQQFPAVLLAGPLGFTGQTFFALDEGERAAVNTAPQVKF